jgi:hypothetical protein
MHTYCIRWRLGRQCASTNESPFRSGRQVDAEERAEIRAVTASDVEASAAVAAFWSVYEVEAAFWSV